MMLGCQDDSVSEQEEQPETNYDQNDFIISLHV